MIEETPQTQRSICASYAKDILVAMLAHDPNGKLRSDEILFDSWADHIYDWIMKDQLLPMSDAQLTKIDNLLRLVKPNPDTEKAINDNKFKYNVKQASEVIEELLKMKPGESIANRMVDKWGEDADSISGNVRERVQRDGT